MPQTMEEAFGELRSLLATGLDAHMTALWPLLAWAQEKHPEAYAAQWIPYLLEHPIHQILCSDLEALESMAALAPHATFALSPPAGFFDPLALSRSPALGQVARLQSPRGQPLEEGGLEALLGARPLQENLSELYLTMAGLTRADALTGFSALVALWLFGNPLGDEGAHTLAQAPSMAGLTSLNLGRTDLQNDGAQALATSPHLTDLEALYLHDNSIWDQGAQALAAAPWARLQTLMIDTNLIEVPGLRALLHASFPLTEIHLGGNPIADDAWADVLADAPVLAGVRTLSLTEAEIGDRGVQALAQCPHLTSLERLGLSFNDFGEEGARALAASPRLSGLQRLDLYSVEIGPEGARALANSPHLHRLESLDLSWGEIGTEGARALAASTSLGNLRLLEVELEDIGEDGARALANAPNLRPEIREQFAAWLE